MSADQRIQLPSRADHATGHPRDLAFDRPDGRDLLDVAESLLNDLERCGFTLEEAREVADRLAMLAETRHGGRN